MKKLPIKKFFVSAVAITTIVLTVSAQKGIFKSKKNMKAINESDCFLPSFIIKEPLCIGIQGLDASDPCPSSFLNGSHVFDMDPSRYTPFASVDCPGDINVCCVYVERDNSPCVGQPAFNLDSGVGSFYYKISDVKCSID